jgi:excisionase family DNA binding protein
VLAEIREQSPELLLDYCDIHLPIQDLSGALAPSLSARDPDCLAREHATAAVLRPGAETRGRAMPYDYGGNEKLLTKGEVAQLCRVEVRTVDRWLIAGKIRCYRTPSGRVLFRRDDVLIAMGRAAAPGPSADAGAPEPRGRREGRAYGAAEGRP